MVGIRGTSSFLIGAHDLVEEEKARRELKIVNEIVFLMEDEYGDFIEMTWVEKSQNIIGNPPFYFG